MCFMVFFFFSLRSMSVRYLTVAHYAYYQVSDDVTADAPAA